MTEKLLYQLLSLAFFCFILTSIPKINKEGRLYKTLIVLHIAGILVSVWLFVLVTFVLKPIGG